MRKWIDLIETKQHWPATLEGWELVNLAREWHHTPEDFIDGDIEHNILSYKTYHLRRVPISDLSLGLFTTNDNLVDNYSTLTSEAPPIILNPQWGLIIDGNHRAEAAVKRGETDILAYVGELQTYSPPEDEDDEEWRPDDSW